MRSSGANGVPLLIPIEASSPRISGSITPSGSRWITASSSSKNETSLAWIVLNSFSDSEMNSIAGGASACDSGYTRRPSRKFLVGASGLPSTSRPRRISQLIRDGDSDTKYPSGIGPS